jgi:hypothetical protein
MNIEVRSIKITKKLLKQIRIVNSATGREVGEDNILGWIHRSVLDDYESFLLLKLKNGEYGRYYTSQTHCDKFPQIYVS